MPTGGNRRAVKPSAQPTLVRTQHLPLPAETARELGSPWFRGPFCVVSSCVIVGQQTSLCGSGYGHMADGIRAEGAVHRTACSCADAQWHGIWLSLGCGAAAECSCRSGLAAWCTPQIKILLLCHLS
jgi:hypothetical protein